MHYISINFEGNLPYSFVLLVSMLWRRYENVHTVDDHLCDGTSVGVAASGKTNVTTGVLYFNLAED